MRRIGFSTGAISRGDITLGVSVHSSLRHGGAIELSALREPELDDLVASADRLDLSRYRAVSVHAPARFTREQESSVVRRLSALPPQWLLVLHPDSIHDAEAWRSLEQRLAIENMDQRKPTGRTVEELEQWFEQLPGARFCLDVAHARHVDPSGSLLSALVERFESRLAEIHVSGMGADASHQAVGLTATRDLETLARDIGADVAVIIESVVDLDRLQEEIDTVAHSLGP